MPGVWLDQPVVVKYIPVDSEDVAQEIMLRLRLASLVRHPALLPILDIAWTGDVITVITPYCEHGSVADLISKWEALPDLIVGFILKRVLVGLEQLHRHLISHGNLKLSNMLINGRGYLQLGDFGFANSCDADDLCCCVEEMSTSAKAMSFAAAIKAGATIKTLLRHPYVQVERVQLLGLWEQLTQT